MNNLTNVDTRKEKIMSVAEFTSETKNKILDKMVLWFDEHYSNEELLHILKEQLELSENEIEALGWDLQEIRTNIDIKHNEYIEYLTKAVKEYCDENGCIQNYWDYRDTASKNTIQEHTCNLINKKTDMLLVDKLFDEISEINFDWQSALEADFVAYLIENAPNDKIKNYIDELDNCCKLYDELYNCGYNGIEWNIEDLLRNTTLKVNILFGTEKEQNYDMGSIVTAFGNDFQTPFKTWNMDNNDVDRLDNALTYLIHQQGHTLKEVYDNLVLEKDTKSQFIEGVCTDITNNSSEAMSELGVYIELSGRDIIDFCDNLQKGNGYIVVDKDTNIGIFNEWSGTCGYPDNYLEKDFVVPVDMIRNVQIEGASKSKYEYTINEVCGMVDEFWKDNALCYTETAPELVQENLNTFFEEINAEVEKLSELEEIER